MPPQYDQWVGFEPYVASSNEISEAGYIRLRTWYYPNLESMGNLVDNLESDPNFRWGLAEGLTEESASQ